MLKCCAIGCLHGHYPDLEPGDLLIVTGDLTSRDEYDQYAQFCEWLESQSYKNKVVIAGNHDKKIEDNLNFHLPNLGIHYLEDDLLEINCLRIWGSPWSLLFDGINPQCNAFTGSEDDLRKKYAHIPDDIDILITHTPPFGTLDGIPMMWDGTMHHVGSRSLRDTVDRIKPKFHIFSHIHEQGGKEILLKYTMDKKPYTHCINCSIMNERYQPVNKPIYFTA